MEDDRVNETFGYAMAYPGDWNDNSSDINETMAVEYWQTPTSNFSAKDAATREYIRGEFLSDNVTYVVFSLNGPITGADSRNFVDDVRDERSKLMDELVVGMKGN